MVCARLVDTEPNLSLFVCANIPNDESKMERTE